MLDGENDSRARDKMIKRKKIFYSSFLEYFWAFCLFLVLLRHLAILPILPRTRFIRAIIVRDGAK